MTLTCPDRLSPPGLDYRKLTDETSDPLAVLQPVLTSQNVLNISKLVSRLPLPGEAGATVSPSAVHAVWLGKVFWKGDPQLLKRPPQGDQDYLHAYDTCAKYLDRLSPADAVRFLDGITFSPEAVNQVRALGARASFSGVKLFIFLFLKSFSGVRRCEIVG